VLAPDLDTIDDSAFASFNFTLTASGTKTAHIGNTTTEKGGQTWGSIRGTLFALTIA